jgi:hypothetical protein
MKNAFLFCLLTFSGFAQTSRISMEYGYGKISSYSLLPFEFGCGFGPCSTLEETFLPTATTYFTSSLNYHLSSHHKIGIGASYSEHGFNRRLTILGTDETSTSKIVQRFKCFKVRHLMKILSGKKIHFGIGNTLELEFLNREYYYFDTKHQTLSHILEVNAGIDITSDFEIFISLLYRTEVLNSSGISSLKGLYNRFGKGMLMGVAHKFYGKI